MTKVEKGIRVGGDARGRRQEIRRAVHSPIFKATPVTFGVKKRPQTYNCLQTCRAEHTKEDDIREGETAEWQGATVKKLGNGVEGTVHCDSKASSEFEIPPCLLCAASYLNNHEQTILDKPFRIYRIASEVTIDAPALAQRKSRNGTDTVLQE
ncbi:hypothetical protein ARMSODRAFT_979364 [Armillaria solidipes]|uniref:Uncharacterized protein n=1 Tax=Armillaria solidipes TaxID=1076256 RepID=A0A2H3B3I6_9AGAR|nr:hypothetical protein ARMSODRAFT_979364 [Armillaria solidipes]